jgi:hypothetical protein
VCHDEGLFEGTMLCTHISFTCVQCCIIISFGSIMELKCPPSLEEKSILITGYIHCLKHSAVINNGYTSL